MKDRIEDVSKETRKSRKWSFGRLFRRKKYKSSDTDCSSDSSDGTNGFLSRRRSPKGRKSASHKVVGKFESIRIPKSVDITISDSVLDNLIKYETSPNAFSRRLNVTNVPSEISKSNQEMSMVHPESEFATSSGSLSGSISRKSEKQRIKARAEALRDQMIDSSSDECLSSKVSSSSPRRSSEESCHKMSPNKRTRINRTDRYMRRRELLTNSSTSSLQSPETPKTQSATNSLTNSPTSVQKPLPQTLSLPSKTPKCSDNEHLSSKNRSSSWPENDRIRPECPDRYPSRTSSPKRMRRPRSARRATEPSQSVRQQQSILRYVPPTLSQESQRSEVYKYSADKSPRSRNPVQVATNDWYCNAENNLIPKTCDRDRTSSELPLSAANEIGIPVVDYNRPLSVVLEKSETEQQSSEGGELSSHQKTCKNNCNNLEEALKELEEIYDSLRLSDEELLERADRRDVSDAIRRNMSRCRYSWSDPNWYQNGPIYTKRGSSLEYLPTGMEVRFPAPRRSVIPDKVEDDMAHRKLNKKLIDPKSTSNIISESGSFLLISPTLSPPAIVDIPPIQPPVKEPDVTLDDVVFRNIRQSNNTLKISDPQPLFGIPVGPVTSAPDSDYLHAVPRDRYRSTFRPSRTPDVVTDDLAFRALRKDAKSPHKNGYIRKREKWPHLSNVVDILRSEVLDQESADAGMFGKDERDFSQMVNEAKTVTKELKEKLRELEAIPKRKKLFDEDIKNHRRKDKEVFIGRVVHHKPITLNPLKIRDSIVESTEKPSLDEDNFSDNSVYRAVCDVGSSLAKLDSSHEYMCSENCKNDVADKNKKSSVKSICDSIDWEDIVNFKNSKNEPPEPKNQYSENSRAIAETMGDVALSNRYCSVTGRMTSPEMTSFQSGARRNN